MPDQTRAQRIKSLIEEKRKQPGIEFPSANIQEHLLIVRADLAPRPPEQAEDDVRKQVHLGLKNLCGLFDRIDKGTKKIDELVQGNLLRTALSKFNFSATVGFGIGFFDGLNIPTNKRPKKIRGMPDNVGLGDASHYTLGQTDLIVQLGSSKDFVNRWVLENTLQPQDGMGGEEPSDIVSAIESWATITDVHAGFQRIDGRNLMGFNDGVSNPRPGSGQSFDEVVWTTEGDEEADLKDGTYMVFQKIEHDLDQWRSLDVDEQEEWVGRKKTTGLLLGTPENDDESFIEGLKIGDPEKLNRWKELLVEQSDPETRFYDDGKPEHSGIRARVPIWSHVRKANPRQDNGVPRKPIFRRGYPYVETSLNGKCHSGLLFVCYQRDIANGFEFIKKRFFNNKNFPVPIPRADFNARELELRHQHGRLSGNELVGIKEDAVVRQQLGLLKNEDFNKALEDAGFDPKADPPKPLTDPKTGERLITDTQNTGREGLAGPSELGVTPTGEFLAIVPFGGGYYFVPPIPDRNLANLGEHFFD
jgi:Dyp-type peroxidase family